MTFLTTTKQLLVNHWTVHHKPRTAEQDEAEKRLFCIYLGTKHGYKFAFQNCAFNRWYLFGASFIIQFCIGSLYAWSVFNKPIDTLLYGTPKAEKAVNAFYIAVGTFGLSTAVMGPWIERNGPRQGMVLGASTFFLGMIISALSLYCESIVGLYIGYGICSGFGMGLSYISPVSALQKWFPDYRGTAAGFAVGGYGAGSVVWGKAYLPIINAVGLPATFLVCGCIMSGTMLLSAVVLRLPPNDFTAGGLNVHGEIVQQDESELKAKTSGIYERLSTPGRTSEKHEQQTGEPEPENETSTQVKKLTLIESILSPDFMFMYLMFFANQLFGLMVLSKLSGLCTDLYGKTASEGATVVSINGVFNCVGRLFLPMISDFMIRFFRFEPAFARKMVFFFTLLVQTIVVSTLPKLIEDQGYGLFLGEVWLLTLTYGGGFGMIPCFLTDMFGAYNIGAMHGIILTAWAIGGVGGGIGFNVSFRNYVNVEKLTPAQAYINIFHSILVVIILGFVVLFFVRTNAKDRFAPGYVYSICDKPIIQIAPRSSKLHPEEENEEEEGVGEKERTEETKLNNLV